MRKLIVIAAAAGALIAAIAGAPQASGNRPPCVPDKHQKKCMALEHCEASGSTVFEDKSMTKDQRVIYFRHCVWLEERWSLKNAPPKNGSHGYILHTRKHRLRKKDTNSFPLLQRAECEAQGKHSYCTPS
jgi:hypothetical protein